MSERGGPETLADLAPGPANLPRGLLVPGSLTPQLLTPVCLSLLAGAWGLWALPWGERGGWSLYDPGALVRRQASGHLLIASTPGQGLVIFERGLQVL